MINPQQCQPVSRPGCRCAWVCACLGLVLHLLTGCASSRPGIELTGARPVSAVQLPAEWTADDVWFTDDGQHVGILSMAKGMLVADARTGEVKHEVRGAVRYRNGDQVYFVKDGQVSGMTIQRGITEVIVFRRDPTRMVRMGESDAERSAFNGSRFSLGVEVRQQIVLDADGCTLDVVRWLAPTSLIRRMELEYHSGSEATEPVSWRVKLPVHRAWLNEGTAIDATHSTILVSATSLVPFGTPPDMRDEATPLYAWSYCTLLDARDGSEMLPGLVSARYLPDRRSVLVEMAGDIVCRQFSLPDLKQINTFLTPNVMASKDGRIVAGDVSPDARKRSLVPGVACFDGHSGRMISRMHLPTDDRWTCKAMSDNGTYLLMHDDTGSQLCVADTWSGDVTLHLRSTAKSEGTSDALLLCTAINDDGRLAVVRGGQVAIYDAKLKRNAPFMVDADWPFEVALMEGSGWHGYDSIMLDESGRMKLIEITTVRGEGYVDRTGRRSTVLQLTPRQTAAIVNLVNKHRLTSLNKRYVNRRIVDGNQWGLFVKQGSRVKGVYFSNEFPSEIKAFQKGLRAIAGEAGLSRANWQPMPSEVAHNLMTPYWHVIHDHPWP